MTELVQLLDHYIRATFPTGFCDALHLFNNCSDKSADAELDFSVYEGASEKAT